MKYNYAVIHDGVFYPPNTEIPEKKTVEEKPTIKKAVNKDDRGTSKKS